MPSVGGFLLGVRGVFSGRFHQSLFDIGPQLLPGLLFSLGQLGQPVVADPGEVRVSLPIAQRLPPASSRLCSGCFLEELAQGGQVGP